MVALSQPSSVRGRASAPPTVPNGRPHRGSHRSPAAADPQRCVNDGTAESGDETRSVDVLATVPRRHRARPRALRAAPGRASLVARIEGTDPTAPTLLLMGHTDVVPVNRRRLAPRPVRRRAHRRRGVGPRRGRHAQPHRVDGGGDQAPGRRRASGPKGTLIYLGVADEEALGTYGADYLVDHERDAVRRRLRDHRVGRHSRCRPRRGRASCR